MICRETEFSVKMFGLWGAVPLCVMLLLLLAQGAAHAKGPGTKLGDVTVPTAPGATLTDLQEKKKCICEVIDGLTGNSSRQKKATNLDKNAKVFLPTWNEYEAEFGLVAATGARAFADQKTGCISFPLTHPVGSLWPKSATNTTGGSELGKKLTIFEEFFHSANHVGPKGWASTLLDTISRFKKDILVKIAAETVEAKKADLQKRHKILCWLAEVILQDTIELDAKINVLDVVDGTWGGVTFFL